MITTHPKLHPYVPLLLAFLLGAFAVLGFAPFYIFPASILALIGLFYLWQKTPHAPTAALLGFAFGLGLYGFGIYWIYISLHEFGGMPWWFAGFCTFSLCAFMSLFPALVGYLSRRTTYLIWLAPVFWGLSDWVRSWIFTGFPWLTLGYSQAPFSPLAGYMPIIGVYGVSTITASLAMLITVWLMQKNRLPTTRKRAVLIAIIGLLGFGGLSKLIPWTHATDQNTLVSLIQGNISQHIKWSANAAQNTMNQYLQMIQETHAPLVVLPETALPVIASELDAATQQAITAHAKQQNGNIIVGMVEYDAENQRYFNSALSFGVDAPQVYRKNHLVPFGEFIPLKALLGWIYRDWLDMPLSDLSRGGDQQQPMLLNGQRIALNICYEDVFGDEIIRQLPAATLLVNISNDAWYGKSVAADQHLQFSQVRALETGRTVLRATNTGATAIIDPHGYIVAHAAHDTPAILTGRAQGYRGSTPYVKWGNWPFLILSFIVIAFVWRRKTSKIEH